MAQIEYYLIFRWMREELHLEGTELHCYAIIFSLSKGDNWYNAGVQNMIDVLGKSKPTIINALGSLTEKELVIKVPVLVNNAKRYYYKAAKTFDDETLKILKEAGLNNLTEGRLNGLTKGGLNNLTPIYNKGNNKEIKEKRLSNDNQKAPDELFLKFWESYGYKKGKDKAVKAWNRLNKKEKDAAIKCIPVYKEDCLKHDRNMKYPSTYLNGKTWEDDFDCDGKVSDEEQYNSDEEDRKLWEKQKEWLQKKLPNIAPEITQGVMKEFTNLAICDKHLLQETLEELNKVYDGGDIVERFKEILNR